DIKKVKDEYGKKICIIGNIDTGKVLSESDPETVEQVVKETIELVAPGGGYMIASANSIHSHVKPENYRTMLLAARKYGDYRFL
ncbi:MAG: nucleoside 2-deoxyribosyltransferase, partial [Spirochaetes bacterium]